jgi:hypothetical protein
VAHVVRFVQRFRPADERAFLALEAQFAALERRKKSLPRGRRSRPFAGREAVHTLIWECEFASLEEARSALARMSADPDHERLLRRQVPYFLDAYTEIYEVLDF